MKIWLLDSAEAPVAVPTSPTETECEIGAAIAVLTSRFGISYTRAFSILIATADRNGRSMSDVAIAVARSARRDLSPPTHDAAAFQP